MTLVRDGGAAPGMGKLGEGERCGAWGKMVHSARDVLRSRRNIQVETSRWLLGLRGWTSRRLAATELRVVKDTAAPSCQEDAEGEKGEGGAQGASRVLGMSQLWWEIAGRIRGSRHGWGVCGGGGVGWARPSASQGQGRQWCQSLLSPQCPARGLNVEGAHATRLGRLGECTNGAPPTSPSSPLVTECWRAPPSLQGGVSLLCLQPRPTV